jgi:hypothetical protein
MSHHNSILGFTDIETVKLDFDDMKFKNVKYWAERTMKWFKLDGYIILKSSKNCYHVIFNRAVSWARNMKVVAWVGLQSQNRGLIKWLVMQCIKQSSTLRISLKHEKPSPRIVFRCGKQDQQIFDFLKMRDLTKKIIKKL